MFQEKTKVFVVQRIILCTLLAIFFFGFGCQLLDSGFQRRLARLMEFSDISKKGVSNYHPQEFYDQEIVAIKSRLDRLYQKPKEPNLW